MMSIIVCSVLFDDAMSVRQSLCPWVPIECAKSWL